MSQTLGGLRAILSNPRVYSLWRGLIVNLARQREFVSEWVRARAGDRVLDVGCGPADLLADLPDGVRYEGYDVSESYIARARARFGDRGAVHCARVDETNVEPAAFDVVIAHGLLHHLSDDEALALFRLALRALKPGGHLSTIDACYVPAQSRVARFLISRDRGQNVRDEEGYTSLARGVFTDVRAAVRHDMLRIPFTHLLLECRKPA